MIEPARSEAELFRRCRNILGLSHEQMADALLVRQFSLIHEWEEAEKEIPPLAWLVIGELLDERAVDHKSGSAFHQRWREVDALIAEIREERCHERLLQRRAARAYRDQRKAREQAE